MWNGKGRSRTASLIYKSIVSRKQTGRRVVLFCTTNAKNRRTYKRATVLCVGGQTDMVNPSVQLWADKIFVTNRVEEHDISVVLRQKSEGHPLLFRQRDSCFS